MKIIEIPNCFKKQTTLCFEVKEQRLVSLLHFFFQLYNDDDQDDIEKCFRSVCFQFEIRHLKFQL